MKSIPALDLYISSAIREFIEEKFYSKINQMATLSALVKDEQFLGRLTNHVALFSDHGVVHMHDVSIRVTEVLSIANGLLTPSRNNYRLSFMKSLGVMLAYLHDIGMINFSEFGRAMHAKFAAQYVFTEEFDPILDRLWSENCGNFAWRMVDLQKKGILERDLHTTLREILALSFGHSKSAITTEILRDPLRLRSFCQELLLTDLNALFFQRSLAVRPMSPNPQLNNSDNTHAIEFSIAKIDHEKFYRDLKHEAYDWLVAPHPEAQEFVADIIDTVCALRCADALRQRGTAIKTSAGYQIFLNQQTGNSIFALKDDKSDQLLLLEAECLNATGEANIAAAELTTAGDIRFAFYQGVFDNADALRKAVEASAYIVNDIREDVGSSFQRFDEGREEQLKAASEITVLLEGVYENPKFSYLVAEELMRIAPNCKNVIRVVPVLQNIVIRERDHYLNANELNWDLPQKRQVLKKIALTGHKAEKIDPLKAFQEVREIEIAAGNVLIEAGSSPGFCYIPLDEGLIGVPEGGYHGFHVCPWAPLGATSIISGAMRNATISATEKVRLLMIPREIYLKYWNFTYNEQEFRDKLKELYRDEK